ncbi:hypothetical protein PCL_03259 [Purpureocillium lilacinum]|uniref:Uncharacterized protein n=1 Tax=Purpureocillium lilacinum TaxID=33203 RepID=A0A2U3ENI5_PURLI|nr:hypothetical protein PCL_03259 [Purpureocillium lilacinum]
MQTSRLGSGAAPNSRCAVRWRLDWTGLEPAAVQGLCMFVVSAGGGTRRHTQMPPDRFGVWPKSCRRVRGIASKRAVLLVAFPRNAADAYKPPNMMAPKLSNFLAVVLMLLGLVAAQQSNTARSTSVSSSSAAASTTGAKGTATPAVTTGSSSASASGTRKSSSASASASASTTKKSAGSRGAGAADSTLITVSLAAGLVVFGVAMS